ncbi:MAG: BrnT family toxin [Nitrospirota bacterium]
MFTWDIPKAIANFEKHRVLFEEAATVFGDANGLDWDDIAHSHLEQRFKRLGFSASKRLLLVVYTIRRMDHEKEEFRIISARPASRRERQAYTRLTD